VTTQLQIEEEDKIKPKINKKLTSKSLVVMKMQDRAGLCWHPCTCRFALLVLFRG
jgi:hypothetical protein